MDIETLKSIIVEWRKTKMTYQQIADKLASEYSVMRSRQSIYNLHQSKLKEMEGISEEEMVLINDVVNLSALGYFMTEIVDLLQKEDSKVSYYKVRDILKKHPERVNDAMEEMRSNLKDAMLGSNYYLELMGVVKYKEWEPKDSGLKRLVMDIYEMDIKESIEEKLNSALNFTDDRSIVLDLRDKVKELEINI